MAETSESGRHGQLQWSRQPGNHGFSNDQFTQENRKEMTFDFAGEALGVFKYAKECLERKKV